MSLTIRASAVVAFTKVQGSGSPKHLSRISQRLRIWEEVHLFMLEAISGASTGTSEELLGEESE